MNQQGKDHSGLWPFRVYALKCVVCLWFVRDLSVVLAQFIGDFSSRKSAKMVKFSTNTHNQILCVIHAFTRILGSVTGPLKNRRAIAEPTLRCRCAVNAQCRRQRRRACVECTQSVREWSQCIRECTQLIREWSPHQRRISTLHC